MCPRPAEPGIRCNHGRATFPWPAACCEIPFAAGVRTSLGFQIRTMLRSKMRQITGGLPLDRDRHMKDKRCSLQRRSLEHQIVRTDRIVDQEEDMSDEIDRQRRRFVGSAAMTLAAAQLTW